jgi:hypothetical protein
MRYFRTAKILFVAFLLIKSVALNKFCTIGRYETYPSNNGLVRHFVSPVGLRLCQANHRFN